MPPAGNCCHFVCLMATPLLSALYCSAHLFKKGVWNWYTGDAFCTPLLGSQFFVLRFADFCTKSTQSTPAPTQEHAVHAVVVFRPVGNARELPYNATHSLLYGGVA